MSQEELPKLTISQELEIIKQENNGFLNPVNVVEYARDSDTALHNRFEWDNNEAAEKYRIWQARQLIRMELTVIQGGENNKGQSIRAYVSLQGDRRFGGYRGLMTVMGDDDLREQLLAEAYRDIVIFKRKYNTLKELAKVIAAMDEVA